MAKRDKTEDLVKELIHEEDWKRMNATAELLKRGPEAVRHLLTGLTDENSRVRAEAALMLGRIKDRTAGVPIVKLLTDAEPLVRTAAAEALQHVADDAALAALVRLLEEPAHRDTAAAVLGRLKDPGALEPLVTMLKSQDATARRMAAEALEQLADPRSADAWIEAMGDPTLRVIASRSLKHIAELRERIEGILNGLRDIEDTVALEEARVGVVMNLIALGRPAVADLLVALEDEHWMVREVAAQALGLIGELRAVEPVLRTAKGGGPGCPDRGRHRMSGETDRRIEQLLAALRDDNEALRDHAVASLGQLGAAAIERLINLFADEDRVIREAARQAVVQVGAGAVPALLESLRDDDWAVREQAAVALGSLNDERAIPPLIAAVKDRDGAVRQAAVLALEKLRDPRAVDGLIEALLDQTVREAAARALKKIPDPRAVA